MVKWLQEKIELDVLCMQEIKCEEHKFPFDDFANLGYECQVFGQKAYNGVAICSRLGFEEVQKGFGDPFWDEQKRFIQTTIKGVTICNVYAPHGDVDGEKYQYKLSFFAHLAEYTKKILETTEQCLVVGDFNVAREAIDVWAPELLEESIGFMEDERGAFERFLAVGLIDLFRSCHSKEHGFTWWDYMGGAVWRDEGMRIDYILATESMHKRCQEIYVDMWMRKRRVPKPSDHAPVVASFTDI